MAKKKAQKNTPGSAPRTASAPGAFSELNEGDPTDPPPTDDGGGTVGDPGGGDTGGSGDGGGDPPPP